MANFVYDFSCAVILFLIYLNGHKNQYDYSQRVFDCFVISVQLFLFLDGISWICEEYLNPTTVVLETIFMTVLFFFQGLQGLFWLLYADCYLNKRNSISKIFLAITIVQMIFSGLLLTVNFFTGCVFYITISTGYVRGPLYLVNYILYAFYFLTGLIFDFRVFFKKKIESEIKKAALINMIGVFLVTFCFIIQYLFMGVNLVSPALSISILMIYLSVQSRQMEQNKINHIKNLVVKTFGNFDILFKGQSIKFKRSKSKELIAYLIDRKGASVTLDELYVILWERDVIDDSTKSLLRNIISDVKQTFNTLDLDGFFIKDFNSCRINTEFVSCDYYDYLNGKGSEKFMGEYMNQYSWAENTAGYLERFKNS